MSWKEGTVVFSATVRRSGNSLVVTIPVELVRRFLLKEGQRVMLMELTRTEFGIEGMIGAYLGVFRIKEKVPVIKLTVSSVPRGMLKGILENVERLVSRRGATAFKYDYEESSSKLRLEAKFGCIKDKVYRPKTKEEIRGIINELSDLLKEMGATIEETKVNIEEAIHTMIDPSLVSKSRHLLNGSDAIEWEWVI